MANQVANRLNFSFAIYKGIIGGMVLIFIHLGCFGQVQQDVSNDKTRALILGGKINDAVIAYALASKTSNDAALISEYAYALALGGIYDAALIQLDRLWQLGQPTSDVKFFISQVYALMGYDDLARVFWKESAKDKSPAWMAIKQPLLLFKYQRKNVGSAPILPSDLIASFNRANELASKNSYFQSLALFHEITDRCPWEFIPYVGYSITLDKIGALDQSLQTLEKGISMIPDEAKNIELRQALTQRAVALEQKVKTRPEDRSPTIQPIKVSPVNGSQMMAYAGGMIASSYTSFNGRLGYFVSGKTHTSFDFGMTKSAGNTSTNIGFSGYSREKIFVTGGGILMSFMNGTSTFYYKLSVGLSFMNKKKTASYDIFLDGNRGMKKPNPTVIHMSLGRSIYFGKRK